MSSYKGIFVQRTASGDIHSVQVEDPFGNSLSLDPRDYLARGVQPPMDQLPDADDYAK
jgi:hypothetical protein